MIFQNPYASLDLRQRIIDIVADEPVSALGVSVQALLAGIKQQFQLSMLLVTHDLRVALQVCDRIAVTRKGEVVEVAATADIFNAPRHAYTKALFAAVPGAKWQDAAGCAFQAWSRSCRAEERISRADHPRSTPGAAAETLIGHPSWASTGNRPKLAAGRAHVPGTKVGLACTRTPQGNASARRPF
jgi:hypothetical protein